MRTSIALVMGLSVLVLGCQPMASSNAYSSDAEEQYQDQVDAYNRQTEQFEKQMEQQDIELERVKSLNDRYEQLLAKWEEQARRQDALLDAEEKKAGLMP